MRKRHIYYQRMLPRLLYGELTVPESRTLEEHLQTCEQCRKELNSTRELHALLVKVPGAEVEDTLLREARIQSRAALGTRQQGPTAWDKVRIAFSLPLVYRPAIAGAVLLLVVLGFFTGKIVASGGVAGQESSFMLAEGAHIANVQFVSAGRTSGVVEVLFDAVKPVRLRSTVDDPTIRKVLAYALMNEENPGVRLRAVGVVAGTPTAPVEPEVKAALLLALRSDPNDGVRRQALKAILRFPPDTEMRDALLQVLLHDKNAGMRVAAIGALDTMRTGVSKADPRMQDILRDRVQNDENLFVRVKSRSLLEENSR